MIHFEDVGSYHINHVDWRQLMLMQAKAFAHQPLNPVSIYSAFDLFLRNGKAQPGPALIIASGQQCHAVVRDTDIVFENPAEFGCG